MKKIPVGQTIASAYRFAFVELERVIGVTWLPIIVLTVIDYFINGAILTSRAASLDTGDASQLGPVLAGQLGYLLVALLLKAVIAVAICREILKPLERPLWLRFSISGTEFRFVGTMLGLGAIGALVAVVCLAGAMSLSGFVALPGLPKGQAAIGLAGLIVLVLSPALIYLFVRLGTQALPAVVTGGGIGLDRSWQLLKGNVGRMLLVSLAATVPLLLVYLAAYVAIVGPEIFNPHLELMGDAAAQLRHQSEVMRQTAVRLPWIEGLDFVLAPFLYGVWFGAQAFAFKALTSEAKPPAI
jgi:hypothetical protein